jgi:MFS family permease
VIRKRPEDYGGVVDGVRTPVTVAEGDARPTTNGSQSIYRDFTAGEAMRTPAFWLISLGHGSALLIVSAVIVHVVSHLHDDLGYSLGAASLVVTLMTLFQVVGLIIGGIIGDRFDKRMIAVVCMGMHTLGLLLVAYAVILPMVIAFAVLHGTAWGCRGPLMQALRADYFGRSSFGVIMGVSSTVVMLGTIIGPLVAGFLADATGSYQSGFTILAVLAGLGSVFFLLARPPARPLREQVSTLPSDQHAASTLRTE